MGLIETILGKKKHCASCGAQVGSRRIERDGFAFCNEDCLVAWQRRSHPPTAPHESPDAPLAPVDVFGNPEVIVYVFRTNDAGPFYALQEQIIEQFCECALRVDRLEGQDVTLVAVSGPPGSLVGYRRAFRIHLGALAQQAATKPERIRPDATYANVSEDGVLRGDDPAILVVCEKVRKGLFTPVFTGPPSVPPSRSAPALRAMTDAAILERSMSLMERHVAFFPGGVVKVESDGVCEAAHLFGELARRRPDDPEPAYLEAAAFTMGSRRELAEQRLALMRDRFPDHLDACVLCTTGQCVFAYPPYKLGQPIPGSMRDRVSGSTIVMTRHGRRAQPVLFADLAGAPLPSDLAPIAHPKFATVHDVPVVGVTVVFAGRPPLEIFSALAGFEEHAGAWSVPTRACYLFQLSKLPVVLLENGSPVLAVEAFFDEASRQSFRDCESAFRSLQPRPVDAEELNAALAIFRQDDIEPVTQRKLKTIGFPREP